MKPIFDELRESLVSYYVLPLLGFGYKVFGPYYKGAKISRNFDAVRVYLSPGCPEEFWEFDTYQADWDLESTTVAVFSVPENFIPDVKRFAQGGYSRMSSPAKRKIYKGSGLDYRKQIDNHIVTDTRLLVLTKHPALRRHLSEAYGLEVSPKLEYITLKNKDSIFYD